MKAIDLAKILYPGLSKQDFIQQTCPDNLLITKKLSCLKNKTSVDNDCIECWNQEVSEERVKWLINSKKISDLMCN